VAWQRATLWVVGRSRRDCVHYAMLGSLVGSSPRSCRSRGERMRTLLGQTLSQHSLGAERQSAAMKCELLQTLWMYQWALTPVPPHTATAS